MLSDERLKKMGKDERPFVSLCLHLEGTDLHSAYCIQCRKSVVVGN